MAASNRPAQESASVDDSTESGVGMAHPTVIPTNFESDRSNADNDA